MINVEGAGGGGGVAEEIEVIIIIRLGCPENVRLPIVHSTFSWCRDTGWLPKLF
jgi:hypothetical protein